MIQRVNIKIKQKVKINNINKHLIFFSGNKIFALKKDL